MAGILYYLPDEGAGVKIERLRELGLGHAFDDNGDFSPCPVTGGPDRGNGVVIADPKRLGDDTSKIGYYADRQRWFALPGAKWQVGCYTDAAPGPADLARPSLLDGHPVRLADGTDWIVPLARGLTEQDGELRYYKPLPTKVGLDAEGNWSPGEVTGRFARLWQIACEYWDATEILAGKLADEPEAGDEDPDAAEATKRQLEKVRLEFDYDGMHDKALEVLAFNYRVGKAEVGLLELFDDSSARAILDAATDWPAAVAFLEKKMTQLAGTPTGPGGTAGSPATDPQSPT